MINGGSFKLSFLVRDRFGEKPIYWGFTGMGSSKALVFGSDISALKEFPSFDKEINLKSIDALMRFSCIPSNLTIYKSINKLKPGHISEFNLEKCFEITNPKIYKWWDYKNVIQSSENNKYQSEKEILFELEEVLKNTLKSCSISDVPVGCFLSGGIDSSLIAALLANNTDSKINTFTIGFEDKNYDESVDAKKIANYLGTKHEEIILTSDEVLNIIPKLPLIYSDMSPSTSRL